MDITEYAKKVSHYFNDKRVVRKVEGLIKKNHHL